MFHRAVVAEQLRLLLGSLRQGVRVWHACCEAEGGHADRHAAPRKSQPVMACELCRPLTARAVHACARCGGGQPRRGGLLALACAHLGRHAQRPAAHLQLLLRRAAARAGGGRQREGAEPAGSLILHPSLPSSPCMKMLRRVQLLKRILLHASDCQEQLRSSVNTQSVRSHASHKR